MDGVLIDSEPSWGQAMLEVMREVGIPYTVDDVARYQGVRVGDIVSAVWDANPVPESKEGIEKMICRRVSELGTGSWACYGWYIRCTGFCPQGKIAVGSCNVDSSSGGGEFYKTDRHRRFDRCHVYRR